MQAVPPGSGGTLRGRSARHDTEIPGNGCAAAPPPAGQQPVRLVATDLDGTLLRPDGSVSSRTVRAVAAAQAAGLFVVPVTGRPPRVTWAAARAAGLGPLGVCANGAAIVDMATMRVVESVAIAAEICEEIVDMVRCRFPGVVFAVEDLDRFTHEAGFMDPTWEWTEVTRQVDDIRGALDGTCMKIIMRRPGWVALDLLEELQGHVADRGRVTSSGLDWVEVGAPGISKAYALERLCAGLGVGVGEVMAVGDNHNDLTVLAWAGHAAAPANAIPEVLAAVDLVLPPNTHDGVAVLLEALASNAGDISGMLASRARPRGELRWRALRDRPLS